MKEQQTEPIDATPSKRLFLSIIADYDLNKAICELIDNALDKRLKEPLGNTAEVIININEEQKVITVKDNTGGIDAAELRNVVGPGLTSNLATDEIIGIFGVGTKRAVVALGADITITSRHGTDPTYQVELDDDWLTNQEDWFLPYYKVDNIEENTTIVKVAQLRMQINEDSINILKNHLGAVYARFIDNQKLKIWINGEEIHATTFNNWSYPPNYSPRRYTGAIPIHDEPSVQLEIMAGLINESSPASGEYGVYFYCNDRLIVRHLKDYHVGFMKGVAGQPHPMVALVRVIVSLSGPANLMPWNSSKSEVDFNHNIFIALHSLLLEIVKDYASLSRRLVGNWEDEVFKYKTGDIVHVEIEDIPTARKSYLPPLPPCRPRYIDIVKQANKAIAIAKPWTRGLYEGIIAADFISNKNLDQKNRISLILLDSTLEIAFKDFLVYDSGTYYSDSQLLTLFKSRNAVEGEIKKHVKFSNKLWGRLNYYHGLRNDLIHKRSTAGISDGDIEEFREDVQGVLYKLFKLKF